MRTGFFSRLTRSANLVPGGPERNPYSFPLTEEKIPMAQATSTTDHDTIRQWVE